MKNMKSLNCFLFALIVGTMLGVFLEFSKPNFYLWARINIKTLILGNPRSGLEIPDGYTKCEIELHHNIQSLMTPQSDFNAVVGHAYGDPSALREGRQNVSEFSEGLRKFFLSTPVKFNNVMLTGDVLNQPTMKRWKEVKEFMGEHSKNLYIAPGNHDTGFGDTALRDVFNLMFVTKLPTIIIQGADYYLITDTTLSPWVLSSEAVDKINSIKGEVRNLYIFSHHILRPHPSMLANSQEGIPELLPHVGELISSSLLPKFQEVTVFSGDTGAYPSLPRFDCVQYENIRFISQGLGGLENDEIIVFNEKEIYRVPLN